MARQLVQKGVVVKAGVAFGNRRFLGTMSFQSCPGPYKFILSIPQHQTEAVIAERLKLVSPAVVDMAERAIEMSETDDDVTVYFESGKSISARFVVGADGWDSTIRRLAGIDWLGKQYPDTYVMGDFEDDSRLGPVACVFLARDGLVESFPLPGNTRRWVAKTPLFLEEPTPGDLAELVAARTTFRLPVPTCKMTSGFRTFSYTAKTMAVRRVLLVGDAAHVVSPIGGQGMNLGWMGAKDLAGTLDVILKNPDVQMTAFREFTLRRRRAAKIVNRRAEFNMWMGRAHPGAAAKHFVTWVALHTRAKGYFADQFSMRGI